MDLFILLFQWAGFWIHPHRAIGCKRQSISKSLNIPSPLWKYEEANNSVFCFIGTLKTLEQSEWSVLSEHTAQHPQHALWIHVDLISKSCCEADLVYYSQQQLCVCVCLCVCMCFKKCACICIWLIKGISKQAESFRAHLTGIIIINTSVFMFTYFKLITHVTFINVNAHFAF